MKTPHYPERTDACAGLLGPVYESFFWNSHFLQNSTIVQSSPSELSQLLERIVEGKAQSSSHALTTLLISVAVITLRLLGFSLSENKLKTLEPGQF
jgi:hypothetical protein